MGKIVSWKLFFACSLICLCIFTFLMFARWAESIPFAESWGYYRNLHPVRHAALVVFGWMFFGVSLSTGFLLLLKRADYRQ